MNSLNLAQKFCEKYYCPNMVGFYNLLFKNYNCKAKKLLRISKARHYLCNPKDVKKALINFKETTNPLVILEVFYSNSHKLKYTEHYIYYCEKQIYLCKTEETGDFKYCSRERLTMRLDEYKISDKCLLLDNTLYIENWINAAIKEINILKLKLNL